MRFLKRLAVGLVLLISAANVSNLLLMRSESRRAEMAVHEALGASRGRIVRQVLAESLALTTVAAAAGFAAAWWSLQGLLAVVPPGLPRLESVRIDVTVVGFTVAVGLLACCLAGLAPALWFAGADLLSQLRIGGRGITSGAGPRGRRALVVAQVAIAVTVVSAAALLTRSLVRLQNVDIGVAADQLMFVPLTLPNGKYADRERQLRLLNDIVTTLESAPNIAAATPVNVPPFGSIGWDVPRFTVEGQSADESARNPSLNLVAIHPNYFRTFGMVLVRGRAFEPSDRADTQGVAIVSEDVAARAWPGQDPIGKTFKHLGQPRTVVGVVGDVKVRGLERTSEPQMYLPAQQTLDEMPGGFDPKNLVIRHAGASDTLMPAIRQIVRAADPEQPISDVRMLSEIVANETASRVTQLRLLGTLALIALLIAGIGIHGLLAFAVSQRSREIGVRRALGEQAGSIVGRVVREGLALAAAGVGVGVFVAYLAARGMSALLAGVQPGDPLTIAGAAALCFVVAVAGCIRPAIRAASVDPITVLRGD